MRVARIHNIEEIRGPWMELSKGQPFCSPVWMAAWAKHCCTNGKPFVLGIFDNDTLVGIAPFHTHRSRIGADRLEFLGTGKACSEYLGILASPEVTECVTDHLSKWMMEAAFGTHGDENRWQRLDLESVSLQDRGSRLLCEKLAGRGAELIEGESAPCWRIELQQSCDEWLAGLNKSIRRKIRLLEKQAIHSGRAIYKIASNQQEKGAFYDYLVRLHTDRRRQLNETGCFEIPGFEQFLAGVIFDADADNLVKLSVVELDGQVVAAGLWLEDSNGLYIYQAGISSTLESSDDLASSNPGWLLNLFHLRYAREKGLAFVDYLRGDERYKKHLGAVPTKLLYNMVVPPVTSAVVRQQVWSLAQAAKGIGKEIIGMTTQIYHP